MMVESYPNLMEKISGLNPGCEISFLPDGKFARWSTTSCALTMTCRPFVSKKQKTKTKTKIKIHELLKVEVMFCGFSTFVELIHFIYIDYVCWVTL
jgi:hypothetical protein